MTLSAGQIESGLALRYGEGSVRWLWQRRSLSYAFIDDISSAVVPDSAPTLTLDNDRPVLRTVSGIELLTSELPVDFDRVNDLVAISEQRLIKAPATTYQTTSDYVIVSAPVLYWQLNDAVGSATVADSSGNSVPGTVGASVTLGNAGAMDAEGNTNALSSNTATSLITRAAGSGLPTGAGARTVLLRVRFGYTAGPANTAVWGFGTNAGSQAFNLQRTSAGDDRLYLWGYANDVSLILPPGSNLSDGLDHTLVVTLAADGVSARVWYDGVEGTPATFFAPLNTVDGILSLGQTTNAGAYAYLDRWSHFAIWDRVLTDLEIQTISALLLETVATYSDNAEWVNFPLGLFRLDEAVDEFRPDGGHVVVCAGGDLASLLVNTGPDAAYRVAAGTTYRAAMETLLDLFSFQHDLSNMPASTLPLEVTWPPHSDGTTWAQILGDLAFGLNWYMPWPGATGVWVSKERIDPSTEAALATYRDTAEPRLISGLDTYSRRSDVGDLPNRCVFLIDDPRHADFGYVLRENADADSEISTVNRDDNLAKIDYDADPSSRCILNTATATSIADFTLQEAASRFHTVSLPTFPDPRRGAHETYVVSVADDDHTGADTLWRALSWTRSLGVTSDAMVHAVSHAHSVTISAG